MPVEITDADDGLGNIIIGRGDLKEDELVDALKRHLTQDPDKYKKYRYSLSDYTAAKQFEISTQNVKLIADYCKQSSIVNPDAVVAIVANKDLIYGLARMWETLADGTNWETMTFKNREDAEAWIKARVSEKYGIEDLTFA